MVSNVLSQYNTSVETINGDGQLSEPTLLVHYDAYRWAFLSAATYHEWIRVNAISLSELLGDSRILLASFTKQSVQLSYLAIL